MMWLVLDIINFVFGVGWIVFGFWYESKEAVNFGLLSLALASVLIFYRTYDGEKK